MEEYNQYWEKHKQDHCFKLPRRGIKSRIILLEEYLKNKNVLHIGCADWPDTKEKLASKTLLHQNLENITKELYGIDLSEEGIKTMKENGIKNLFIGNIYSLHDDKNINDKKFDVIVVSEILEHLTNPGLALDSIRKYVLRTNPNCEVIFTVPNYQNFWYNLILGLIGKEIVHYDHKFYFSYRTFRNLIENYNFEVDDFYFVTYGKGLQTLKGKILSRLFSKIFQCITPHLYFRCHIHYEI